MQQMTLTNNCVELQTPCSFQVKSGGRVAVCVEEVPTLEFRAMFTVIVDSLGRLVLTDTGALSVDFRRQPLK